MSEIIIMTHSSWKTTDLTEYANSAHVKELLEGKHPYKTDKAGRTLQYFNIKASKNGFLRIEAPEALTTEEKKALYERGAALQQDRGLDKYN